MLKFKSGLLIFFPIILLCLLIYIYPPFFSQLLKNENLTPKNKLTNDYNILLITIDTLRPDYLGCYSKKVNFTKNIDYLASNSMIFSNAITPCPITLPAHASLLSGLLPFQHGIRDNGTFYLCPETETITEILKQEGYKTAAFIGGFPLHSMFGLNQGFDIYDDNFEVKKTGIEPDFFFSERKGIQVVRAATDWIGTCSRTEKLFLWIHLFDPHAPYSPPEEFKNIVPDNPYACEVSYSDYCIGIFLSDPVVKSILDRSILILTSDHGESLGQHGEPTHTHFIYDSTLKIPLIIHFPEFMKIRGKYDLPVSLIDLFPTILDLINVEKKQSIPGVSLVSIINSPAQSHRSFYCETFAPYFKFGWTEFKGIRTDKYKLILSHEPELYNLKEDPNELVNIYKTNQNIVNALEDELSQLVQRYLIDSKQGERIVPDKKIIDRLSRLGYMGIEEFQVMNLPQEAPIVSDRKTPSKEVVTEILTLISKGIEQEISGTENSGAAFFRKILTLDHNNLYAKLTLGAFFAYSGKLDSAQTCFCELLKKDPGNLKALSNLGMVYFLKDEYLNAKECFSTFTKLMPNEPQAHYILGKIYTELKDLCNAEKEFKIAHKIDPQNY